MKLCQCALQGSHAIQIPWSMSALSLLSARTAVDKSTERQTSWPNTQGTPVRNAIRFSANRIDLSSLETCWQADVRACLVPSLLARRRPLRINDFSWMTLGDSNKAFVIQNDTEDGVGSQTDTPICFLYCQMKKRTNGSLGGVFGFTAKSFPRIRHSRPIIWEV